MKKDTFLNSKIIPLLRKGFFLIKKNAFLGFKKVQFYENKFKPNSFCCQSQSETQNNNFGLKNHTLTCGCGFRCWNAVPSGAVLVSSASAGETAVEKNSDGVSAGVGAL